MRRGRALLSTMSLALMAAAPASVGAEGINLYWNDCSTAGVMHRSFACDDNAGFHEQVASFVPPDGVDSLYAIEATWDACSMGQPWPAWWHFVNPGFCRQAALTASADFSGFTSCADPWQGAGIGGIAGYTLDGTSWDAARLRVAYYLQIPTALTQGIEHYAFRLRIANTRTVGEDACTGCTTPVCIVLNQISLDSESGRSPLFMPETSYSVTWQAASPICPFVVPARNVTWGQVKSLYR